MRIWRSGARRLARVLLCLAVPGVASLAGAGVAGAAHHEDQVTGAPSVLTEPAGSITTTTAILSGQLNPAGQSSAFFFQYGTSANYGEMSTIGRTGATATAVTAVLTHLAPGTGYHFRLVAINASGTSYGADMTFRTASKYRGSVLVHHRRLRVRNGQALVPLTCASGERCRGRIAIRTGLRHPGRAPMTIVCTAAHDRYTIGAHARKVIRAALATGCLKALAARNGSLAAELIIHPSTPQQASSRRIALIL